MVERLLVSGTADGSVQVSYRREGEEDAQSCGEPVPFESPLSATDLEDLRWYLEQYLLAPYALYEERGSAIAGKLGVWGEALFEAVFGHGQAARDAYLEARETTNAELVIQSAAPGFLSLPWELIKDPERATPLALDAGTVEARLAPAPTSDEPPVAFLDPATAIALGNLLVAAATLGWTIYSELRQSSESTPSKEVVARRTRLRLESEGYVPSDTSRRVVEVVIEEIIESDPTEAG